MYYFCFEKEKRGGKFMLDGAQFEALRALVLTFSTEEQLAKMIDFTMLLPEHEREKLIRACAEKRREFKLATALGSIG
ncbi:hypothetical protein A2W57_03225 [Candidatus Giovannonibacteria bacterium RIFCSPHIGHO2_02_43_16]|uniref:Uncharacterized protein n=2 Tax=Candidatus Giovannoniibacteriota TaxID=1752738 RepID=A0A1F5WFC8_9BACT|nr:MAG: hypothetical protein A2W57_03225 [Candidatus Giovannonibacteria bacterium RIFCSPHIGHO2_02_43_16]